MKWNKIVAIIKWFMTQLNPLLIKYAVRNPSQSSESWMQYKANHFVNVNNAQEQLTSAITPVLFWTHSFSLVTDVN